MSRWTDDFENHTVQNTRKQLMILLNDSRLHTDDESSLLEIKRIHKLCSNLDENLDSIDAEILPLNYLNDLQNDLQQILDYLISYANSKSINHLHQTNSVLDNALSKPFGWIFRSPAQNVALARKTIQAMERLFEGFVKNIREKTNASISKIDEIKNIISQQEEKILQLSQKIEEHRKRVDELLSQWQQQFSQAQESRYNEFTSWRDSAENEAREKFENLIDIIKMSYDELYSKTKNEMDNILVESREKHNSILELYELSAGDSVGGGYLKSANTEGKQAFIWRITSVMFIVLAVAWLIWATIGNEGRLSWQLAVTHLPVTAVLLYGAAYAAQQSTRHRNVEVLNRKFALEMAAIDPYLHSLSETDAQELKKELAKRFFGNIDSSGDKTSLMDEHAARRFIKGIVDDLFRPLLDSLSKFK